MAEDEAPAATSKEKEEEAPPAATSKEEDAPAAAAATSKPVTKVMIAVSRSSKGYPNPSISSRHALEWVLKNLVKPCCKKEYKLLILHVQVPDEDGLEELDSVYASPSDFQHLNHEERSKGHALLKKFIQRCHEAEIECEGRVRKGDPKQKICEETCKRKPDILVLGSRGLGILQRMFVAGVSSYCTKNVDCPVLVIKRDPKEAPEDPMDD